MALNALSYLIFLPAAAAVYYLVPARFQKAVLLAASLWFYWLASAQLTAVMLLTGLFVWQAGLCIGRRAEKAKAAAVFSVGVLVAVLCVFKYTGFFVKTLGLPNAFLLAAPLGVSFYTFMAIGYLADVAKGRCAPVESFWDLLLFLCFFGTVSSGPILRAGSFIPQLKAPKKFDADRAVLAMGDICVGLFYKVAVSDIAAVFVNAVYNDVFSYTGLTLTAATFGYSAQLYFDFAGYSLLAMGSAKLLGFDVPRNFTGPYFARSVKEFWSRWHRSLSDWLRDYIYIPLGGNRKGAARRHLNLMITFAVSGVWHGAGWCFLIWGLVHGGLQVAGDILKPARMAVYRALHIDPQSRPAAVWQWLWTFLAVNFAWVFFRSPDLRTAGWVITRQFADVSLSALAGDIWNIMLVQMNPKPLLCMAVLAFWCVAFGCAVALDAATRFCAAEGDIGRWLCERRPFVFRWLCYYALTGMTFVGYLLNNGYFATAVSFIYNNF